MVILLPSQRRKQLKGIDKRNKCFYIYSMNDMLIYFDYKGESYTGILSHIMGTGGRSFQLFIGSSCRGQLNYSKRDGWQFAPDDHMFEELANWFGDQVIAFYFNK